MKIGIIGCGNVGTALAADLSIKGHEVLLIRTSSGIHNDNFQALVDNKTISIRGVDGTEKKAKIFGVTRSFEDIPSCDLIIITVQTNFHERVIEQISLFIRDGQTIIFEPGYMSTCYVLTHIQKDITIIEAESSPIDCRITAPGEITELFRNVLNPFGVYPQKNIPYAKEVLNQLGYPYRILNSVIEAALHNPNLIVHTIGAIFSIPRIEYTKGDYWMYKEVFTPCIWNVVEALDAEKMNVMKAIGVQEPQSYVQACQERNFVNDKREPKESFFDYAYNSSPEGPKVPNSRYITEDVPQGLVMLESLGEILSIQTPTCSGLINCASAAIKTDFREHGRTVERLGKANIDKILRDKI